ncbi:MAG: PSD1 and planctomycete cytochrome C domain-containing protein [Isosphaeraceae bacterium]
MKSTTSVIRLTSCLLGLGLASATGLGDEPPRSLPPAAGQEIDFTRDIAPIFSKNCHRCHGTRKQEGGLALHEKERALSGGDTGPALVPGKSAESRLIRYVAGLEPDNLMPPDGAGKPLAPAQIGLLRAWIDQGARWPEAAGTEKKAALHWSFAPPVRPDLPAINDTAWPRNAIDHFVLARLEKEGLKPSPEARKETLIRRLSLDLIGLPPTPEEVAAFLADERPDAYERLVERLLASPHYGECWGRHWLDRARYADTNGYEKDRERSIWPFRDWVIRALNRDMPFDRFTVEQIAGDLLPGASLAQRIATGFHRNTMINEEGGIDVEEFRYVATVDRVNTTGAVWLGLTIGCAQCHSHKYDPITQREYYRLLAFLDNADEPEIEVPDPETARKQAEIDARIAALEAGLESQYPAQGKDSLEARMAAWEKSLHPARWTVLRPSKLASRKNATMSVLPDGSVLAGGDKPNNDVYEVELPAPRQDITAIRLEVLTDPSLPEGGPGRAPLFQVGDFLLTEFQLAAGRKGENPAPLAVGRATEDYAAPGRSAALATDGITDTGWSVNGRVGQPHTAVFELKTPLAAGRAETILVTMHQEFIHQMTIGRFRLSATSDRAPVNASGLPAEVEEVLLIAPEKRSKEQASRLKRHYLTVAPELVEARKPIDDLRKTRPRLPTSMVMQERPAEHARTTHVHKRGEFLKRGEAVSPGVPAALHSLPPGMKGDRLALAKWLVDGRNPLVGRVVMNQMWQTVFGRGLVGTPEDFGTQGARPTHPELLDWLATEWIRQGWSQKAMLRLLVTSATYRQRSEAGPERLARDPKNELLSRGPRFRVPAETVRDIALAAGGLLTPTLGGPSVHPPQPEGATSLAYGMTAWPTATGADRYRRGLYTYLKRTAPYAAFITMDAPTSDTACVRRERSNTPLQALTLLNDTVFVEASQALARRLLAECPSSDPGDRIRFVFRVCLGRDPGPDEAARVESFLTEQLRRLRSGTLDAARIAGTSDPRHLPTPRLAIPKDADLCELAAWTTVARAVLNLDETITKE